MTLIITAMSPYRIVQVSDRRLTLPGGALHDDGAIKAVTVNCDDAYFSVAYTGTAYMLDRSPRQWKRTDMWIASSLHDLMQQGYGTARELYRAFGAHAANTVALTPAPLWRLGITFVFARFFVRAKPDGELGTTGFVGVLSNTRMDTAGHNQVVRHFDTQQIWSPAPWIPYNELELNVHGMIPALASKDAIAKSIKRRMGVIERRLERTQRGSGNRNDSAIAHELVRIVRMASRHPQYGKYIGRDCMTVIMNSETPSTTVHTHMENSVEHDWPWMVSRDMVMGGWFSITTDEGRDVFPRI
jgi:hypothetical protein